MAISLYFGLPGCGKTTWLTKLALDAVRKGKYQHVYTNVGVNIPGVTFIDNDCIGKYELENCLLLIDEATLFADNRAHKEFTKGQTSYFLLHRHRNADIVLFTQQWDGVDKKIRVITDRVYYIYKGILLGHWFSSCWRVPYGILFPDPKKTGEKLGEIVQGYSKPNLLVRIFATKRIFRPLYYKYFDSWELQRLPDLPDKYKPITANFHAAPILHPWVKLRKGLIRKVKKIRKADKRAQRKAKRNLLRSGLGGSYSPERLPENDYCLEGSRGAPEGICVDEKGDQSAAFVTY